MKKFILDIQNTYTFTVQNDRHNDTAICTFTSPHIEDCFSVVIQFFTFNGYVPFFQAMEKHADIILTSMFYLEHLWEHLFPTIPFKLRHTKYTYYGLPCKIFRFPLQPVSNR